MKIIITTIIIIFFIIYLVILRSCNEMVYTQGILIEKEFYQGSSARTAYTSNGLAIIPGESDRYFFIIRMLDCGTLSKRQVYLDAYYNHTIGDTIYVKIKVKQIKNKD
jgi:hypothetical protein